MSIDGLAAGVNGVRTSGPEVFSARDLATAAGVPVRRVRDLIATGQIATLDGELVGQADAIQAVRDFVVGHRSPVFGGALAISSPRDPRSQGLSTLMSMGLHLVVLLCVALLTPAALTTVVADREPPERARLIFVAEPGPGGGGGGGGLRQPAPPPKAERKGPDTVSSPVPERVAPKRIEPVRKPRPPELDNQPLPSIVAPLVAARAQTRDIRGLLVGSAPPASAPASQGPGHGGGVGSGSGTGIGEGRGAGVGPGFGGGTGGGPYRPGSGIEPPRVVEEVSPDYTEEARRRSIQGDVVLELIVEDDGSVGRVRLLKGLGFGLDERAMQAVRQWRFVPAHRLGTPVAVVVEVAVAFRLR